MMRYSLDMSAFAVGAGIFASRVIGFVRDRVFAHYLGNDVTAGAFRAALRIPNLLQNLFGEGALSASFIPVYAKLLADGQHTQARQVASMVFAALLLLVSVLVLLGLQFASPLTALLAPGFADEVRQLTVELVKIMLPGMGLLVLAAWCLGILNSHRRFFLSYAAPVVWSGAMIASLLYFGGDVLALAWATVVGAAVQFFVQLPAAWRVSGGFVLAMRPNAAARRVVVNFVPAVMSRGVVQISAYIDQILASYLGPAIVAGIGYAQTLYMLPVSLFGMAVSAAELPAMAGVVGQDEAVHQTLRQRQETGLRRIAFFVVPSAIGFLFLGDVFLSTLFETGRFGHDAVLDVWWILAGSSVALLASTQGRLITSGLWALGDTRTPLRLAIIRVSLAAILGYVAALPLRAHWQLDANQAAAGLSLASSIAAWLELYLARRALSSRIGRFSMNYRAAGGLAVAALLSAGLARGGRWAMLAAASQGTFPPWLLGGLILCFYGLFYLAITGFYGEPQARQLLARLQQKVLSRLRR